MNRTEIDIARVCDEIKSFMLTKNMDYEDTALNPVCMFSSQGVTQRLQARIDDRLQSIECGIQDKDTLLRLISDITLLLVALDRDATRCYNDNSDSTS